MALHQIFFYIAVITFYSSSKTVFFNIKNIFYLLAPDGIKRSKLVPQIEKAMAAPVTGRNFNTIKKLKFLMDD